MTGILGQLKWESLKKRRKDNRLILLNTDLKGKARIPTDDLIPKTRRGRNQHSFVFQIPSASKDVYKYSFFHQTIRDWNDLPESLISSPELSDDSVSKFTSLVRARDLFPPVTALVKDCQFGVSSVNYSDSEQFSNAIYRDSDISMWGVVIRLSPSTWDVSIAPMFETSCPAI